MGCVLCLLVWVCCNFLLIDDVKQNLEFFFDNSGIKLLEESLFYLAIRRIKSFKYASTSVNVVVNERMI